uniref:Phosphoserine aminotransferase n=1 Tax=Aegilops tauschii TaxID=37682 RepID=N1QVF2_AEGTA
MPFSAGSFRITASDGRAPRAAPGAKPKVVYHDPSIPRPQDVYLIRVNNCNSPFDHVWLERSEDGTRPIHPLEKLPVEQFIDRNVPESEPVRPADVDDTPFTLVEDLKGLTELVNKLKDVNEFAVDLEHNQYRSFQGLTCLMQISTRTEDFIIDTLKLRIYIGSYLKELFKDPTKRKVMHGADRDIMWLQRDFRVYVCNLFDTGQVQKRSNDICLQLYEKELLTDKSYLHIYGLQEHELAAAQLAVVSALHQWRDYIAREQDESTGYVLPNKALIEIAKKMPTTTADLRRIVKSKYPCVEDNFDLILDIVWNATENSGAFEAIAEQLKKVRLGELDLKSIVDAGEVIEMAPSDADNVGINFDPADQYSLAPSSTANIRVTSNSRDSLMTDATLTGSIWLHDKTPTIPSSENKTSWSLSGLTRQSNKEAMSNNKQETQAPVQELKRPTPFGALVGNSTSGRQTDYFGGFSNEQAKSDLDQIQSSAYYYPQFADYSSLAGWSHHEPEGTQAAGFMSGCYYGHGYQSINQSGTGTRQPAARNNGGGFQDLKKQQPPPHSGAPRASNTEILDPSDLRYSSSAADAVLRAQAELVDYRGPGMSLMEMSHRGKEFDAAIKKAEADLRALLAVPDTHEVLFLQGGATTQFAAAPLNLCASPADPADFVVSGSWSDKAFKEAKKYSAASVAWSGKAAKYTSLPADFGAMSQNPEARFLHICSNETIHGVEFKDYPEPRNEAGLLVADMSSNFCSKPVDVSRFGLIYAGAQKNVGPSGVTIAIVRKDLVGSAQPITPVMLDYKTHADNASLYNTPPCFAIYICGLVFEDLLAQGGLAEVEKKNQHKAGILYDTIDASAGYFVCPVDKPVRSLMNVPFTLAKGADSEKQFIAEAAKEGMLQLKGHRSVGGVRASIYNAMPLSGVEKLVAFMKDFQARNP